ncbi:MAG: fused MFS/spermidine synthase [Myxococcaceae bacterium]|nr:fused MFS/spermidine synthase [Myxococcaceae bacterium]
MRLFGALLFGSAFLLFGVQPLAAAWALPVFGGGPAIWTTCMLFFQGALLGGYGYAHLSVSRLSPRAQTRLHAGVVGAVVALAWAQAVVGPGPLVPAATWQSSPSPTLGVLGLLATTVGPVFLALAASAPLFQTWFSRGFPGQPAWRLYAVSNAGSLGSLLSFPFLVEPLVGRTAQGWAFLCLLTAWAALVLLAAKRSVVGASAPASSPPARAPLVHRLGWLALACIPNVVLIATTQRLSEDVAAGPLQWLLPLSLYLVTFIICFEKPAWYRRTGWLWVLGLACVASAFSWVARWDGLALQVGLASVTLFAACMVCHGELYALRPVDTGATGFYLVVSAGGVLGGLFCSLVAPNVFTTFAEYPLGLGAACVVGVLALGRVRSRAAIAGAAALGLCVAVLAVSWEGWRRGVLPPVWEGRNFFGVLRVESLGTPGSDDHEYSESHGRITHGWQYQAAHRRREVSGYFSEASGVGRAIAALREDARPLSVGVLGLGVGQLANFGRTGDSMRFYEINPLVIALAKGEGGFFTVLADSEAAVEVVLGDARLSLEREAPRGFDLLVVDVFTGDSIPSHLLTREAYELYRAHLSARGVIAVHITNRYLDLEPVMRSHATHLGLALRVVRSVDRSGAPSVWAVLASSEAFFSRASFQSDEVAVVTDAPIDWTDEHHSLLPLLLAR